MSNNWLAAESFERVHSIISALNTLSIHAKMILANVDDTARSTEVMKARAVLRAFLESFGAIVKEAERTREGMVTGADPRLSQLARTFVAKRRQWPQHSPLYDVTLSEVDALLESDTPDNLRRLIAYLQELRVLLEQNVHADIVGLLGEI